jgi:hypothetical protein
MTKWTRRRRRVEAGCLTGTIAALPGTLLWPRVGETGIRRQRGPRPGSAHPPAGRGLREDVAAEMTATIKVVNSPNSLNLDD